MGVLESLARRLFEAYRRGDLAGMRSVLADNMADNMVAHITNAFAAFLARVEDARVQELWMVEARPATATSSGPKACGAEKSGGDRT